MNLTLTEESGAAAAARRALREGNGVLPPAIRDDVLLLVTELVTNAVRHAGAGPERPVQVRFCTGPVCRCRCRRRGPDSRGTQTRRRRANRVAGACSSSIRPPIAGASSAQRPAAASGSRSAYPDRRRLGNPPRDRPPSDSGPLVPPGLESTATRLSPGPASRSPGCWRGCWPNGRSSTPSLPGLSRLLELALDAGGVVRRPDGFGLGRAALAQVDGGDGHRSHGQELRLPVR